MGKAGSAFATLPGGGKTLVVFYSKSGNTQAIAEMIQEKTGGDICEIQTVRTYPRERPAAADIPKEERETGNLPELKEALTDVSQYETVFIGSPIWWYTVATPVMTFLRDVDFQGKTVAGFRAYAGDGRHFKRDLRNQSRNALQEREIATISALASMEGVDSQLQAHFNIGFNTGLTEPQMKGLISVLAGKVRKKEADNANGILGRVLSNKAK